MTPDVIGRNALSHIINEFHHGTFDEKEISRMSTTTYPSKHVCVSIMI